MILRLLIVDDDTSLANHLRTFFERQKYKVEVAHDGIEAVARAMEFHPHLMFLDIGMPGKSGIEVLRDVKAKDPSVRVIMITGQTEDELMRQARLLGADDYVTKPFTLEYLSGEVMDKLHKQLFHELRATSQDLAIEHEKAELLFGQVKDGVILFDSQGLIFMANPVAQSTLGLPKELNGLSAAKIFESFQAKVPDRLQHLDNETGEPFDLSRDTPRQLVLEIRINTIFSPKKDRYGYLALFRDVTMERKADTAMHRFISLISHKLRTPLVTIRAYPRLLLSENSVSPLNDFQKNALLTIQKQCQMMEDMVNQLIAFSSLDPEELLCQKMSGAELLTESLKLMPENQKDKLPSVKPTSDLSHLFVHADPTLMQHAVRNIIENAFKFGAKQVEVSGHAENGSVIVSFKDDGPGIPPEDLERVFDRFYQVEKTFCGQVPGAGLGLTMVKQTVEAHGGKVWAESKLDKGTTLFLKLPAAPASTAPNHG
jgi:two-component system sensor histidine kinase VicK